VLQAEETASAKSLRQEEVGVSEEQEDRGGQHELRGQSSEKRSQKQDQSVRDVRTRVLF
jgi:hypothetical protein